ncbi:MAG: endonuclease MutS2 [SAR324 cluster bacterium]
MREYPSAAESSLEALEWPRLLDDLASRLRTAPGQTAFAGLRSLDNVEAIRRSLTLIQELKLLLKAGVPLEFDGVQSIGPFVERAEKQGVLSLEELAAVSATQQAALRLQDALTREAELPGLREFAHGLHSERRLCASLAQAIAPDGTLDERAYPQLAGLRADIGRQRAAVHRLLESLIRSKALEHALQEPLYTLRGHRYVLPIKTDFRGQVPGIVHDVSASGATLFIEPHAVVEETNALALLEKRLDLETERILRDLSLQVGYAAPSLRHNLGWLGRLDLLHAQARLSEAIQGTAPEVWSEGRIALRGLAHPLMLLAGAETVRNDLTLGGSARCLVISGANSGGKTVLLKAVGLTALLLAHGMHIPALGGSRMDWFPHVWAEVGDPQDLGSALSTFSARVRFVADILARLGAGHLALLDELMSGTEPQEGAALAGQVVRTMAESGAIGLVSTHYGDLKLLAGQVPGVINASVSFDPERLVPTFHLEMGLPGASYAFPIALRYGLAAELVERAQAGLAGRPAALDGLLHNLQALRGRTEREREEVAGRQRDAERRERELVRRGEELDARRDRVRRQEQGEVSRELREARAKIAAVIHELQSANSLPFASRTRERLMRVEQELTGAAAAAGEEPAAAPLPSAPLAPGDTVLVRSMGRAGSLLESLDEGRSARVQLGAVTAVVRMEDLAPAPAAARAPQSRGAARRPPVPGEAASARLGPAPDSGDAAAAYAAVPSALPTLENTLDVRGLRLHEALAQAERFFDQCVMKHVSPVILIHGHGTGRLKAGLRERLKTSRYVAALRPGDAGEGRDGVTVLALNV